MKIGPRHILQKKRATDLVFTVNSFKVNNNKIYQMVSSKSFDKETKVKVFHKRETQTSPEPGLLSFCLLLRHLISFFH